MLTNRTEFVLMLLDDILAERFGGFKVSNLRRIERTAKRMADGIEQRERDEAKRSA